MGLEEQLRAHLDVALDELSASGQLDAQAVAQVRINVEPPRKGGSGHLATNAALVLAKAAKQNPRQLGETIAEKLRSVSDIAAVEVAGPGFLNITFEPAAFHRILVEVITEGDAYGRGRAASKPRVNVEFVSANPTGPLLISHGRGAVLGDVVARLLEAAGHRVTREYYINDFGNQVRLLGESVANVAAGQEPPEGGYGGNYVRELADWIGEHRAELLAKDRRDDLKRQCITLMLDGVPGSDLKGIRPMLREVGIEFDVWTSEEGLHRWGRVQRSLDELERLGRLSTGDDGAVYFVTGDEDEKDRVVKKSNGDYTYFASDIAYHDDKIQRGFRRLINLWGADHHGYVARLGGAIEALGYDKSCYEVLLFQLVKLVRDGKEVRMGKRLGNLITLQEVVEEIDEAVGNPHAGRDALRVFYLLRSMNTSIVLDVELAKKQEAENPVFYMQYGHARLASIQQQAKARLSLDTPRFNERYSARVTHPLELDLLAQLGRYPSVIAEAAEGRDPHKVVFYLNELAQSFQSYYTQTKKEKDTILPLLSETKEEGWEQKWDWDKTRGRLLWVSAIKTVYRSGLQLLGLEAPERMSRSSPEEEGEAD